MDAQKTGWFYPGAPNSMTKLPAEIRGGQSVAAPDDPGPIQLRNQPPRVSSGSEEKTID